jgi:hypothetical protein
MFFTLFVRNLVFMGFSLFTGRYALWRADFSMLLLTPAIPRLEFEQSLEVTFLTGREIRFLFHNPAFRVIKDRTTQTTFPRDWAVEECLCHINAKTLGLVEGIIEDNIRKILCKARRRVTNSIVLGDHLINLTQDQKQFFVQVVSDNTAQSKFLRKGEFLTEVGHRTNGSIDFWIVTQNKSNTRRFVLKRIPDFRFHWLILATPSISLNNILSGFIVGFFTISMRPIASTRKNENLPGDS